MVLGNNDRGSLWRRCVRLLGHWLSNIGFLSLMMEDAVRGKNCRGQKEYLEQINKEVGYSR